MTRDQFAALLAEIQDQERAVRAAGQKEYAHETENCFANFERIAKMLGVTREKVLLVYLMKHMDGIVAYVNGHRSQREDVRGRMKDARLYLALLWGMVSESAETVAERAGMDDSLSPYAQDQFRRPCTIEAIDAGFGDK